MSSQSFPALYNGLKIRVTLPNCDPNSFYAQIGTSKQLEEFDKLEQELNEWARTHSNRFIKFPEQSSYALVQDGSTWYRAIVTDVLNTGVKVFLIDVGRYINVYSPKKFCTTFPKLMSMAQQALECSLVDIELNTDWSVDDAEVFQSVVNNNNELLCSVFAHEHGKWLVAVYYKQKSGVWKSLGECLHQLIGDSVKYSSSPQVQQFIDQLNAEISITQPSSLSSDSDLSDHTLHDSDSIKVELSPAESFTDVSRPLKVDINENSIVVDEDTPPHTLSPKSDQGSILPTYNEMQTAPTVDTSPSITSDEDDPVISEDDWKEFNGCDSSTPPQKEPLLSTPIERHLSGYSLKGTPRPRAGPNVYKQSSFSCDSHYTKKGRKTSSHNEAGRGIGRGRGRGRGEHPCYSEKFEYPVGGFPNYDKSKSVHLNHSPDLNYTDGDRSSGFHDNSSIVQSDYSISPPITVSNIHSHLGLNTDEAIKNEIEWLTYRIQNQTKKIQSLLVQNPQVYAESVSVILNGGNARKLSMIQSPGKPMHLVLVMMVEWILSGHVTVDAVIQVIHELYGVFMNEIASVYNEVCVEVFQKNLEGYPVDDVLLNKRRAFCSFFVNLYWSCQMTKNFNLMDVVTDSLCSFYSYWTTKLQSGKDTNGNFETYVKCMCYFDTKIGMDIDKKNRKKLDNFFENIIPNIIIGDLLSKSLKLDLIGLFQGRRDQLLACIQQPLPANNDPCPPGALPYTNTPIQQSDVTCYDKPPFIPVDTKLYTPSIELQSPVTSRSVYDTAFIKNTRKSSNSVMASPTTGVGPDHHGRGLKPTLSPHQVQISSTDMKTSLQPAVSLSNITANTPPQSPSTDPYHMVSVMLSSLDLYDLFTIFKTGMIQDRVLSCKKHELKSVLKEVGIPPGAILSILNYVTEHRLTEPVSSDRQASVPSVDLQAPVSFRVEPERKLPSHSLSTYGIHGNDQPRPTIARSPLTTPTIIKDNSSHEKKTTEFGSVQRCVMCGSREHRGYSCPRRTELMFASVDSD